MFIVEATIVRNGGEWQIGGSIGTVISEAAKRRGSVLDLWRMRSCLRERLRRRRATTESSSPAELAVGRRYGDNISTTNREMCVRGGVLECVGFDRHLWSHKKSCTMRFRCLPPGRQPFQKGPARAKANAREETELEGLRSAFRGVPELGGYAHCRGRELRAEVSADLP